MSANAVAEIAEARLVKKLPTQFFLMAKHDAPLAIAMHALCDLIEDGCFREAHKLNQAIATRLELLAVTRQE